MNRLLHQDEAKKASRRNELSRAQTIEKINKCFFPTKETKYFCFSPKIVSNLPLFAYFFFKKGAFTSFLSKKKLKKSS